MRWILLLALIVARAAAADRPNLLFVLVDDLRFDDIACAPGAPPFLRTPHVDRIAREGAMFTNAFATTPLCSPSRASFLTGLYAHHHGITDNTDRSPASHKLVTFPLQLQQAGYDTAYLGKWHMGNDNTPRPGFAHWLCLKGQGEANDPLFNEDGREVTIRGYVTDILTEKTEAFLRRKREAPFAIYLAHKALHPNLAQAADGSVTAIDGGGFIAAPRHRELYAADAARLPRRPSYGVPPRDKPALARAISNVAPLGPGTVTSDQTILDRLRMLAAVDEGLGRLLAVLAETGQLDRTLIVFAGDHGYFYGEHGLDPERRLPFEESARIPLLMRYPPRIPAGARPARIALNIDLAPTLLDLAQVKSRAPMDGRSLLPLFANEPPAWRESFLIEYYSDQVFPRMRHMGYKAVRTERHKYVRYADLAGMDELYDLREDPHELRNIIGSPAGQAALPALQAELNRLVDAAPK
jgi:arylsulfatase A-like enzyme